uniref:SPATA31-like domain-containing protein n=1 Tax=Saimiri boliviensis boliviensis TaxID=39432 RepID=A0A2K6TYD4_SAIBB
MPRAQLPEGSSAVDIDIVFPPESIRLSSSPMLWMMHFILIVACSLVILAFLCSYIFRKPSSAPPRKRNAEVRSWLRIRNKKITLKACRSLLKNLENARDHTLLLEKRLRKLPGDGSFHCLLNRDRLTESFKRGPGSVHRPHGRCGKASPTSLSPQAPLAPLASMPSPDLKTSIGSFESLSTLSTSQPPEPLRPLKHPSHPPHAGTLLPNPTTSVESLGETPHAGRGRQGSHFPQPGRAKAAGHTRHQNPRHHPEHRTS